MIDPLPRDLRLVRDRVRACANAFDLLERALIAREWNLKTDADRVDAAYAKIERTLVEAADLIGIQPKERMALVNQITKLQAENARLTTNRPASMEAAA